MARRGDGFSLVELIVVIVVTGIIAGVVGGFIASPIQAFIDQARRAELVDAAQIALTRMGRDVQTALPNSVRVQGGNAIEVLLTLDGDRYRTEPPGDTGDVLDFSVADTKFNTFNQLGVGQTFSNPRLAIYPLGQPGADPYVDPVLTPASTTITISPSPNPGLANEFQVVLGTAHRFPFQSPTHRVFLVDGPVSYMCDTTNPASATFGDLLRYSGYAVSAVQPVPPPVNPEVVVKHVQACSFQYAAGTAQRNAVVSLSLILQNRGERVRLIRQVHVENTP